MNHVVLLGDQRDEQRCWLCVGDKQEKGPTIKTLALENQLTNQLPIEFSLDLGRIIK